jgi:thymidylate kinase
LSRPVVVEFVGLPGAGKSTLAARLLEELTTRGYDCVGRELLRAEAGGSPAVRWKRLRFWLGHVGILRSTTLAVLAVGAGGPEAQRHAARLGRWASGFERLNHAGHEIVLLDQGVVQQAWSSLFRAAAGRSRLLQLLDLILRDAAPRLAFVYCDVPLDVALQRIAARPGGRSAFDGMDQAQARRLLASHGSDLRELFAHSVETLNAPHLTVDTGKDLAGLSRSVSDFVISLVPAGAERA